jgi:hypothetical protein
MVQVDFSNCSVEVSPVPLRPCPSDMIPSNYRRWRVLFREGVRAFVLHFRGASSS